MNRKFRLIITLTLILATSLFLCGCNENQYSAEEKDLIKTYLAQNYSSIDVNDNTLKDLSILVDDAKKSKIIFTGESHSVQKNFAIKLALLKYLHQNAEVRYLLCEAGYASTKLLNDYIQTGNKASLDLVYEELKGTAAYSKESYDFWVQLYEYNKTMNKDSKIIAIGVDIEHQIATAISYLLSIKGNGTLAQEHIIALNSINELLSDKKIEDKLKIIKDLKLYIDQNEEDFIEYYGDLYFDFKLTIDNIYNACLCYTENFDINREQFIYENFKKVYNHYPKLKYYGQWGSEHIYQHNCETYLKDIDRFAVRLNYNESPVKDKVLSIKYAYKDSKRMDKSKGKQLKVSSGINDMSFLNDYIKSDYTLFKLNGMDTPFNNMLTFIIKPYGGITLDYYQYILVINDSKGTTMFK